MEFVSRLLLTLIKKYSIWVILDRLTKSTHRYPRFTSQFWKKLHKALGTCLDFSTAFHLQADAQSEQFIQILEDMLRGFTIEFHGSWEEHLPLAEFSYNSFQSNIQMESCEVFYGRKCRTPLCLTEFGERKILGPEVVQESEGKIRLIQDRLKAASNWQKLYFRRPSFPESVFMAETVEVRMKGQVKSKNHGTMDATWELKDTFHQQYPHLFEPSKFEDKISLWREELSCPKL
ncbi:reverse transcriptase [Gossypium australe]|uniref:Reverse transcriptase n=1 Tax=Gossypium australe TaxID=47621 RepID=A0A5B6UX29_9ROSI|nr:reverse transcriptase [Gossypium australe]